MPAVHKCWVILTCVWSLQVCCLSSAWALGFPFLDGVLPELLSSEEALSSSFTFYGPPNKMKRNRINLEVLPCVGAMWLAVSLETQICLSKNKTAFMSLLVSGFVGSFFCHEKAALAFIFVLAVWPPSDPKHLCTEPCRSITLSFLKKQEIDYNFISYCVRCPFVFVMGEGNVKVYLNACLVWPSARESPGKLHAQWSR